MKKLSRARRDRDKRRNIIARREGRRNAKRDRYKAILLASYVQLIIPPVVSIFTEKHRSRLVQFIRKFKQAIVSGESKILLDFSQTEKINAGGMILLYAEITRCVAQFSGRISFKCKAPKKNSRVAQVLVQLGFASLFREVIPHRPKYDDVVNWRVASGDHVQGEKFDDVLGSYDGVIPKELSQSFFRGISEAMTNVRQHAYMSVKPDLIPIPANFNKWWMFSQNKDGKLSVLFCDLGIGIPKTIPQTRPQLLRKLATLGLSNDDASTIESTVEDTRSRTGLKHRGKGLPQIVDSVRSVNGIAGIYSNRGRYVVGGTPSKKTYQDSVEGTIIFWQVDLPGE